MKPTIFILIIFAIGQSCIGQVNDNTIRKLVLEKSIVDSGFVFGRWSDSGATETHLKYLGQLTTLDGSTFKIMNSTWLWGFSHRATSRILIYNDKNEYVGNYVLSIMSDLPDKLERGHLIFTNNDNTDCDKNLTTKVDFSKKLPKDFFIKCKGEQGDIYIFSLE